MYIVSFQGFGCEPPCKHSPRRGRTELRSSPQISFVLSLALQFVFSYSSSASSSSSYSYASCSASASSSIINDVKQVFNLERFVEWLSPGHGQGLELLVPVSFLLSFVWQGSSPGRIRPPLLSGSFFFLLLACCAYGGRPKGHAHRSGHV